MYTGLTQIHNQALITEATNSQAGAHVSEDVTSQRASLLTAGNGSHGTESWSPSPHTQGDAQTTDSQDGPGDAIPRSCWNQNPNRQQTHAAHSHQGRRHRSPARTPRAAAKPTSSPGGVHHRHTTSPFLSSKGTGPARQAHAVGVDAAGSSAEALPTGGTAPFPGPRGVKANTHVRILSEPRP